jgi:hypothetical protein
MNTLKSLWIACAGAALLAGTPALAQKEVADAPDPWVHAATGVAFPARVGEFERLRVVEYTDDGRDASAGYRLERGGKWVSVTFYIYPVIPTMNCQQTFADVKAQIANYKGATVVREGLDPAPAGRGAPVAHYVRYQVPAGAMRQDLPAVRSDAYLFCAPGDRWLVKYRATGSPDFDFGNDIDTLMHAIAWTGRLGG